MFSINSIAGGAIAAAVTYIFMKDKISEPKNLVRLLFLIFVLGTFFSPFILIVFFWFFVEELDLAKILGQISEGNMSFLDSQKSKMHDKIDEHYEKGSISSFERDQKKDELDQKFDKMQELIQSRKKKDVNHKGFDHQSSKTKQEDPFKNNPDQPFEIPEKTIILFLI